MVHLQGLAGESRDAELIGKRMTKKQKSSSLPFPLRPPKAAPYGPLEEDLSNLYKGLQSLEYRMVSKSVH